MKPTQTASGPAILVALMLLACSGASKLDYGSLHQRAGWQKPEAVIEALDIEPGARVADIGAGDGYFLPYLAEAVGPEGRVFAVDVDAERVDALERRVAEAGHSNVTVVLANFDDPLLPDAGIDLTLLCNTYHHIEERPAYFEKLLDDLDREGRVAVIEPNEDLHGLLRLFLDEGHTSSASAIDEEMSAAGYQRTASFDFLPIQLFEVYSMENRGR